MPNARSDLQRATLRQAVVLLICAVSVGGAMVWGAKRPAGPVDLWLAAQMARSQAAETQRLAELAHREALSARFISAHSSQLRAKVKDADEAIAKLNIARSVQQQDAQVRDQVRMQSHLVSQTLDQLHPTSELGEPNYDALRKQAVSPVMALHAIESGLRKSVP